MYSFLQEGGKRDTVIHPLRETVGLARRKSRIELFFSTVGRDFVPLKYIKKSELLKINVVIWRIKNVLNSVLS